MYKRQNAAVNLDLLDRVAEVFRGYGYAGASLSAIAASTGLSKASLYHHFPGGKPQMAEVLIERAIAQSEHLMYAKLRDETAALNRLNVFLDGYLEYTEHCQRPCLLSSLGQSAPESVKARIGSQLREWQLRLESTLCELRAVKPKRAARLAEEALCSLYGATSLGGLIADPTIAERAIKRLRKNFEAST